MKTTLSIKVSDQEKLKLKRVAKSRRKTPSDLMREALDLILRDPKLASEESCYAVAEDLFQYRSGNLPSDLSSDKGRLKGFGE